MAGVQIDKSEKPIVSVLMTAYNREIYIADSIKSVLESTYQHFELIIVDDASTDQTVAIVKGFAEKDNRIKLYINDENLGDYPNRNKAASFSTGKYIKYIDSDDYIYPHGLEIMVQSMEQFPEAGFGLCALSPDIKSPFPFILTPKESYEYHFFGPGLFSKGPLSSIFLKTAFEAIGGFKPIRMISDTDLWYRISLNFPVVLIQNGIVWQRRHLRQELSFQKEYIFEREKIKWQYLNDPACKLISKQLKKIKGQRIKRYIAFILSGFKRGDFQQVSMYFKCLKFVLRVNIDRL